MVLAARPAEPATVEATLYLFFLVQEGEWRFQDGQHLLAQFDRVVDPVRRGAQPILYLRKKYGVFYNDEIDKYMREYISAQIDDRSAAATIMHTTATGDVIRSTQLGRGVRRFNLGHLYCAIIIISGGQSVFLKFAHFILELIRELSTVSTICFLISIWHFIRA